MREAEDMYALGDTHSRAEDHMRFDDDIPADLSIRAEEDGLGGSERHTIVHGAGAIALLKQRFNDGQLPTRVHAADLIFNANCQTYSKLRQGGESNDVGK